MAGRPKKSSGEHQNVLINVRFREAEGQMIKDLAKLYNVSLAKLLRILILKAIELPDEDSLNENMRSGHRSRKARGHSIA